MTPCNYVHTEISDIHDTVSPLCIYDKQQQLDYLGSVQLTMLYNTERAVRSREKGI